MKSYTSTSLTPSALPILGKTCLLLILLCAYLPAFSNAAEQQEGFENPGRDYALPTKNMRKWDAPVVADLDQDGWVDLVLNDHGYSIQILWNNKGKFSKPWDLVMGDLHGVTVGDYDQDGLLEMVVSRGGGSGSNARNSMIYRIGKDRKFERLPDFPEPLAMMRGRTVKFFDGDHDGDLDLLNFAFPDNEKKGASENYIYKNDGEGMLLLNSTLPPALKDGQKTLLTDYNKDGHVDLILYGHNAVRSFKGDGKLGYVETSEQAFPEKITKVTGIVEADIDNDGDFDLYLSRGDDFEHGDCFYCSESNVFGFFAKRSPFEFEDLLIGNSDLLQLENYQSPWPNKKIYQAETGYEYKFPGELDSGHDVTFIKSNVLGWPDTLPNKGLYVGFIGNERWRIAGNAGSPLTAVIHDVHGNPPSTSTVGPKDLLLENRNGTYVDVTDRYGIADEEHTVQIATADFDNNGFADFLVIRRGNLVNANESFLYMNKGDGSFEKESAHGIISPELGAIGLGVEVLDYNKDGKVDVMLCNERGKWHLFKNGALADGNYVVVDLGSSSENKSTTLGALISVESGGQVQTKRSGACGAMYSRSMDRYVHFGLGSAENVKRIQVRLTDGTVLTTENPSVNSILSLNSFK